MPPLRRAARIAPLCLIAAIALLRRDAEDRRDAHDARAPSTPVEASRAPVPAWGVLHPVGSVAAAAPEIQVATPGWPGAVFLAVRLDDGRSWSGAVRGRTTPWPRRLGTLAPGEGGLVRVSSEGRSVTAVFRRGRATRTPADAAGPPGWRAWFSRAPSGTIPPFRPFLFPR